MLDLLVPILHYLTDARADQSRIGLMHIGINRYKSFPQIQFKLQSQFYVALIYMEGEGASDDPLHVVFI